jgi:hypothetical protein
MDFEENMDARNNPVFAEENGTNGTAGKASLHQEATALLQHKEDGKDKAKE